MILETENTNFLRLMSADVKASLSGKMISTVRELLCRRLAILEGHQTIAFKGFISISLSERLSSAELLPLHLKCFSTGLSLVANVTTSSTHIVLDVVKR